MLHFACFPTELGWFGLWGHAGCVVGAAIGQPTAEAVREAFERRLREADLDSAVRESDWTPSLRRRLQRYARGEREDFADCPLDVPASTPFRRRVLEATRRIPYGSTTTYGKLAEAAGSPRAARAVGSVMAQNRVPILIPCHRVVAAGGNLGGYSAPQGIDLKRRLLAMERPA